MRILTFEQFCSEPDGTIFSYWEPCVSRGLNRRGAVLRGEDGAAIDFYEASLLPEPVPCDGPDGVPVVCLSEGRWGMYEYGQLFAVYETADLVLLAVGLGLGELGSTTGFLAGLCAQNEGRLVLYDTALKSIRSDSRLAFYREDESRRTICRMEGE